jgi:hypothetical protein
MPATLEQLHIISFVGAAALLACRIFFVCVCRLKPCLLQWSASRRGLLGAVNNEIAYCIVLHQRSTAAVSQ